DCLLAIFKAVRAKVSFAITPVAIVILVAGVIADSATEIKNAVLDHSQIAIISRRDLQTDNTILNSVGVDLYHHRLLRDFRWFLFLGLLLRTRARFRLRFFLV